MAAFGQCQQSGVRHSFGDVLDLGQRAIRVIHALNGQQRGPDAAQFASDVKPGKSWAQPDLVPLPEGAVHIGMKRGQALAQGFAGLGSDAGGFAQPSPETVLQFPADHGAHPDFRIEWWYLTATLTGPDGTDYGAQWTLFRTALRPGEAAGFASPQLWMGHAALTSAETHLFAEKLGRGGVGQAGVTPAPFKAWIDDWQMISRAAPFWPIRAIRRSRPRPG